MAHIDTLETFDKLVESGIPESQARAQINALEKSFDSVATKDDLNLMEKDLKREIKEVERDLKKEIKEVEKDLTNKLENGNNNMKFFILKTVVSTVVFVFLLPVFRKLLGWM